MSHDAYRSAGTEALTSRVRDGGVVMDVKSVLDASAVRRGLHYWSL